MSCSATSTRERCRARPTMPCDSGLSNIPGNMVRTWNRTNGLWHGLWRLSPPGAPWIRTGGIGGVRRRPHLVGGVPRLPSIIARPWGSTGTATSRHSRTPLGLPRRLRTRVPDLTPATERLSMAKGVFFMVSTRIASVIPGTAMSMTSPSPPASRPGGRGPFRRRQHEVHLPPSHQSRSLAAISSFSSGLPPKDPAVAFAVRDLGYPRRRSCPGARPWLRSR